MHGVRKQALTAVALLVLAGTPLVAGCGPEAEVAASPDAERELLGERPGKLTCLDWRAGTAAERRGTIEQLTMLAGANANPQDLGPNRVLSEDDAYASLEGTCQHQLARGFLLYEIYNRAAAFWPGLEGP